MGLLARIFRSIYHQPPSEDEPYCPYPVIGGNQLSLSFWFPHGHLRLDIGPSVMPDHGENTSATEEMAPPPPSPHQEPPAQAPDTEQQSTASTYRLPRQRRITAEDLRRQDSTAASFWDALDPTEREVLRSVAFMQTFAAGATIMHEGERADHVIVILGGKVRICVNEEGKQRIVAERGLGQLVGERGALQISVRSATVIALEMVWALVVQTKDFAVFVSAHPRVLALVQEQLYDRGTDEPVGHRYFPARSDSRTATSQYDGFMVMHPQQLNGENCTVILTDVVAFGSVTRTDRDRLIIREALSRMTYAAMQGIPDVWPEDRGDGMLLVIPPDVPTARVMDQLVQELPGAIDRHNRSQGEASCFQLRLAINVGPVVSDAVGVSGEAIIVAARLLEAADFKDALAGSAANLGVIASPFVYEAVIRHSQDSDYAAVAVEVKESRTTAWMKLFDTPLPAPAGPCPTDHGFTMGLAVL